MSFKTICIKSWVCQTGVMGVVDYGWLNGMKDNDGEGGYG